MDKTHGWIHHLAEFFYLILQSFIYYSLLQFIYIRLDFAFLPLWSLIWVVALVITLYIAASLQSKQNVAITLPLLVLIGLISGLILFETFFAVLILIIGLTIFAIRRASAYEPVNQKKFLSFFAASLLLYCLFILVCYFAQYTGNEIRGLIIHMTTAFFITLIGLGIVQLYPYQKYNHENFWKEWGMINAVKWGGLGLLGIASAILLFFVSLILKPLISIFASLFYPVFKIIFTIIYNIILYVYEHIPQKEALNMNNSENELDWLEEMREKAPDEPTPMVDGILHIVTYAVIIGLAVLLIALFFRAVKRIRGRGESISARSTLLKEDVQDDEGEKQFWWRKQRRFWYPYSGKERHPVRQTYRQVLSLMREKGLWEDERMTAEQINSLFSPSERTAHIYNKLRYGDQDLTQEEVQFFKNEMTSAMQSLKEKE